MTMLYEIVLSVVTLLSISAGIWSILYINRLNNVFKLGYLSTFLYYQILLFVFGVYGLLGMAVVDEILKVMNAPSGIVETMIAFLPFLGFPFLITAWYMFIKMSAELVGKKIRSFYTVFYFTLMMLLILGLGVILFYLFKTQPELAIKLFKSSKFIFIVTDCIILLFALYYLYLLGSKIKNASTRTMVLTFAHINIVVKVIVIISYFFAARDSITGAIYLLIFFSSNIPTILFFDRFLNNHFLTASDNENYTPFIQLIQDYSLSKREWEIIEKICEGMTNKEISDKLFISLQTVKDHCYKIYKKTGVRNRVQLVNLIRSNKK